MSKPLIQQYYNQLDRSFQFSKSKNEDTIKSYFWMLMNDYAQLNKGRNQKAKRNLCQS
jgi:serine/threonine protein phosphatase PrpC